MMSCNSCNKNGLSYTCFKSFPKILKENVVKNISVLNKYGILFFYRRFSDKRWLYTNFFAKIFNLFELLQIELL